MNIYIYIYIYISSIIHIEDLRDDQEVGLAALRQSRDALQHLSDALKLDDVIIGFHARL